MNYALLTAAVLAISSSVAAADTITVCLDGSCDYTDIQSAINAASDGDVIEIAAGTYYPGATIDTIGKAVTLRGEVGKDGAPTTMIDGQDSIRIIICQNDETANTRFENLYIKRGLASGDIPDNQGGGMYLAGDSAPTLQRCWFVNCSGRYGGAMYIRDGESVLTHCRFYSNEASDIAGAIYFRGRTGSSTPPTNLTFEECEFEANVATSSGGGIYASYGGLQMNACLFIENESEISSFDNYYGGGAIFFSANSFSADSLFTNCQFIENQGDDGAAIYHGKTSAAYYDCDFVGNEARGRGGAMYNRESPPYPVYEGVRIIDCTFTSNDAQHGTAIGNYASMPKLTRCLFQHNDGAAGGVIGSYASTGPVIEDCILCGSGSVLVYGPWVDAGGNCFALLCDGVDDDDDGDGVINCKDGCPDDPKKVDPGDCGCGVPDTDTDGDGTPDCNDGCPFDSNKIDPGFCGCGLSDVDENNNGTPDCADCGGPMDGGLWVPCEYPTIRDAIDAAVDGDIILLEEGMFLISQRIDLQGKSVVIRGTVDGNGNPVSILDANGITRVLQLNSGEDGVLIENLVIRNGNQAEGGGMYISGFASAPVTATFQNCIIEDNSAGIVGGGAFVTTHCTIDFIDCRFSGNSATIGGGVASGGGVSFAGTTLCGNPGGNIYGDYIDNGGNCIVDGCTDADGDGIPDKCADCPADFNGDDIVDGGDVGLLIAAWGTSGALYDLNGNGQVDGGDVGLLIAAWGPCAP